MILIISHKKIRETRGIWCKSLGDEIKVGSIDHYICILFPTTPIWKHHASMMPHNPTYLTYHPSTLLSSDRASSSPTLTPQLTHHTTSLHSALLIREAIQTVASIVIACIACRSIDGVDAIALTAAPLLW